MTDQKYVMLGIDRDEALDYYVKVNPGEKGADVWSLPRPAPGEPKTKSKPTRVSFKNFDVDYDHFNYFVDADGDVSRRPRNFRRRAAAP